MAQKKKKAKDRSFIAINPVIHSDLKKFLEGKGWGIGWFAEKAIEEKMQSTFKESK